MSDGFPPLVFVDLYQTERKPRAAGDTREVRPQLWRWRAINGSNFEVMAIASEAYTNKQDCLDAIAQLFGASTNVYLRQHEQGDQELRLANNNPVQGDTDDDEGEGFGD